MRQSRVFAALRLQTSNGFAHHGPALAKVRFHHLTPRDFETAISARNVFSGKVTSITEGPINAEVEIATAGGSKIVAIAVVKPPWVTLLSGTPATALFKAGHVVVGVPV